MGNLGLVIADKEPVYVLQRQPFPERKETRFVIWVKDDSLKISSSKLSKLLADVLQSQTKTKLSNHKLKGEEE